MTMNPEICRKKCHAYSFTLCSFTEWSRTERFEEFKNEGHNLIRLYDGLEIKCGDCPQIDGDNIDIFIRLRKHQKHICQVPLKDSALDIVNEKNNWYERKDNDGFIVRARNIDDDEMARLQMNHYNDFGLEYCPFYMEHQIHDWNNLNN